MTPAASHLQMFAALKGHFRAAKLHHDRGNLITHQVSPAGLGHASGQNRHISTLPHAKLDRVASPDIGDAHSIRIRNAQISFE